MTNLKNVDKISAKYKSTLKLLDAYVGDHKSISKLVVFGPSIENEDYINSEDAEMYLAMYFKDAKDFTDDDFTQEACALEREIPYVLTYTMQNSFALKKESKLQEDVKRGITIYDCKETLSD